MNKHWIPPLILMALIFFLSHQPASESNNLSQGISERMAETIERVLPNKNIDIRSFNHLIRKAAHFFAYLLLGVLVTNALDKTRIISHKSLIWALIICIIYAASDEIHQIFIPGRAGQIKDVALDSAGSMVGIFGYFAIKKLF